MRAASIRLIKEDVYHALSAHLSRAKLIARSTIDMPWRNFPSPEFKKKFQSEVPLFLDRSGRKKPSCQNRPTTSLVQIRSSLWLYLLTFGIRIKFTTGRRNRTKWCSRNALDLTVTSPWLCRDPTVTLPWPHCYPTVTSPWPCRDLLYSVAALCAMGTRLECCSLKPRSQHTNWTELKGLEQVDLVIRRIYSAWQTYFVFNVCGETRTVTARLVLNTCISTRLFTLEFANWTTGV